MNGAVIVNIALFLFLKPLYRRALANGAGRETPLVAGIKVAINQLESLRSSPELAKVEIQNEDIQL